MKLATLWPFTRKGYRTLRTEHAYSKQRRHSSGCVLCDYDRKHPSTVETNSHWLVVANKFPYQKWDWLKVENHLMIIPIRHITKLNELTAEEWRQFTELANRYDAEGYSTYLRSPLNELKTIDHLHWHLIKTS